MTYFPMVKALIKKTPGFSKAYLLLQALKNSQNPFLRFAPPGHYYSPIPDLDYIKKHGDELFVRDKPTCPGLQLNVQKQTALVKDLSLYYSEIPFPEERREGERYYFNNSFFGHGCAIMLYSLMRHFHPQRIVEVGSGYSSAAMLDVNDCFFGGSISFSFIEPYPERLLSLLTGSDKAKYSICVDIAQHVPHTIFTELKANDILFIDSSHVAKIGSDVVYLLTDILPILQSGVIIHIHDIYWPFEYPEDWVLSGTAWNEAYLLKAFLQFNSSFEILLFNSYLSTHHQDLMKRFFPMFLTDAGSSLWIRKTS